MSHIGFMQCTLQSLLRVTWQDLGMRTIRISNETYSQCKWDLVAGPTAVSESHSQCNCDSFAGPIQDFYNVHDWDW